MSRSNETDLEATIDPDFLENCERGFVDPVLQHFAFLVSEEGFAASGIGIAHETVMVFSKLCC
jgi:hypothetical protein